GYDSSTMMLSVTGNGIGMTGERMEERLGTLGGSVEDGAVRSFFHRGVREVILAVGSGEVTSIGVADGEQGLSSVRLEGPTMAFARKNARPTDDDRTELGLASTGTLVVVPVRALATAQRRDFEFSHLLQQIENCVGLRVVLMDPDREVTLQYDDNP